MARTSLRRSIRTQIVSVQRNIYRNGRPQGRVALIRQNLASLGAIYTFAFTVLSLFSGFWLATLK